MERNEKIEMETERERYNTSFVLILAGQDGLPTPLEKRGYNHEIQALFSSSLK